MDRRILACWILFGACAFPASSRGADFRWKEVDPGALGLWEGDSPVLVYNHGVRGKEKVPADRKRSSYFHPIHGLDGEVLTDDFPADHYHHRGLFWAWPHLTIAGKPYDLWMLKGIRHQFERWTEKTASADKATLALENGWYVGETRVVAEQVRCVAHPAKGAGRFLDVTLTWTALKDPVRLGGAEGKGYGGLSLRFAPRQETEVRTPEGIARADLNLKKLPWADLSARFGQRAEASGIALFVPRSHPDYPPTWITRNYGFLGVGWPGIEGGTLDVNQPIRVSYRLWIHRGRPTAEQLQAIANDWKPTP